MSEQHEAQNATGRDFESSEVLGAAIEVHRNLGRGFPEEVYLEALCLELALRDLPFQREDNIPAFYKGQELDCDYRAGVLCFGSLLVEPRAQMELTDYDEGPVLNYLRQTKIERALLINFGTPKLQIKRLIYSAAYRQQRENARMTDSLES